MESRPDLCACRSLSIVQFVPIAKIYFQQIRKTILKNGTSNTFSGTSEWNTLDKMMKNSYLKFNNNQSFMYGKKHPKKKEKKQKLCKFHRLHF